jgi:hypothetical protein
MITTSAEELERPGEWLRAVLEGRRYRWLLDDAGSVAVAAYRVARARCRVQPMPTPIPTLAELCVAARSVAEGCGLAEPPTALMLDECDRAGLIVIAPVSRQRAA